MQARYAVEHGKLVFPLDSLVTSQDWARAYLEKHQPVLQVSDAQEVVERLRSAEKR